MKNGPIKVLLKISA